jgi:diguanylate cyclase (GGDEF)-like protein/PAS domain S-box-containing protein
MDNVAEGIVTMDEDGRIESFNPAAEKLFGYTMREVAGKSVEMLMPEEYRGDHQSQVRRYLETGQSRIIGREPRELTAQRKDGTPFSIELAVNAVQLGLNKVFVGLIRDVTERKAMVDQLRHIAEHDALTGLYNRRYFYGELERVVARARRGNGLSSALMFIDLDKFKLVNDTLGHAAGDRVLIDVANILKNRARKSDVLTRLGGDEFAVLLYDASAESAPRIAESFRQQILNYRLQQGTVRMSVGCSIGVTIIDEQAGTLDAVLAQADHACYQAKHAGRNCVRVFDPRDSAKVGNAG